MNQIGTQAEAIAAVERAASMSIEDAPQAPGVYVIRDDVGVQYVGGASHLRRRLASHNIRPVIASMRFNYIECLNYAEVERWLIEALNPAINIQTPTDPELSRAETNTHRMILARAHMLQNTQIAEKVGLSQPTVSRIFTGNGGILLCNLEALLDVLGLEIVESQGSRVSIPIQEFNALRYLAGRFLAGEDIESDQAASEARSGPL